MNILFVAHAATRGGAAGVLLELLRYVKRETSHQSTILTVRGGPLEAEFRRVATPFANSGPFQLAALLAGARRRLGEFPLPRKRWLERLLDGAIRLNGRRARQIVRRCPHFDIVYANSAASGEAIRELEPVLRRGAKLIVHVHEMAFALSQNESGWSFLKRRGDLFIAASEAVRTELVNNHGLKAVVVVNEWVDFETLVTDKEDARRTLRERIGVPLESTLVGGCGTIEQRKGTDWWVQSAFYTLRTQPNAQPIKNQDGNEVGLPLTASESGGRKAPPPIHFVWLGGEDNAFAKTVKRDTNQYGIEEHVHFLPALDTALSFFAGLDIFFLSSREDPFPLVAVEAAAQGVPVACFARAGGAEELVKDNGGIVASWGDCAAMGRALSSLSRDTDFRVQLGCNIRVRAHQLCDAHANCTRVVDLIERCEREQK